MLDDLVSLLVVDASNGVCGGMIVPYRAEKKGVISEQCGALFEVIIGRDECGKDGGGGRGWRV